MGRRTTREPGLFTGPLLLPRTRRSVADLVGAVWLLLEIARLVRSRLEKPRTVSPPWDIAGPRPRREDPAPNATR